VSNQKGGDEIEVSIHTIGKIEEIWHTLTLPADGVSIVTSLDKTTTRGGVPGKVQVENYGNGEN
jgi:hypothetical protein